MNLNPPSILLPAAGAALGYWLGAKSSWAIGAGVLAGVLGNTLLNLANVKADAAKQVYADVGNGRGVAPSMGSEIIAGLGLKPTFMPVYPQSAIKGAEVERLGGSMPTPSLPPQAGNGGGGGGATPTLGQQLESWAKSMTPQAAMGHVAGVGAGGGSGAATPGGGGAKRPAAARFHRGAGR